MNAYYEQQSKIAPFKEDKEQTEPLFLDYFFFHSTWVSCPYWSVWSADWCYVNSICSAPDLWPLGPMSIYPLHCLLFSSIFLWAKTHYRDTQHVCTQRSSCTITFHISSLPLEVTTSVVHPPPHSWPVWSRVTLSFINFICCFVKRTTL